jgi:hypothetical protein
MYDGEMSRKSSCTFEYDQTVSSPTASSPSATAGESIQYTVAETQEREMEQVVNQQRSDAVNDISKVTLMVGASPVTVDIASRPRRLCSPPITTTPFPQSP